MRSTSLQGSNGKKLVVFSVTFCLFAFIRIFFNSERNVFLFFLISSNTSLWGLSVKEESIAVANAPPETPTKAPTRSGLVRFSFKAHAATRLPSTAFVPPPENSTCRSVSCERLRRSLLPPSARHSSTALLSSDLDRSVNAEAGRVGLRLL